MLGMQQLFIDLVDLIEVYFYGEWFIVIGCVVIEVYKVFLDVLVLFGVELQKEVNEIVNLCCDNVLLVLNKWYIVKCNV